MQVRAELASRAVTESTDVNDRASLTTLARTAQQRVLSDNTLDLCKSHKASFSLSPGSGVIHVYVNCNGKELREDWKP